MGCMAVPCAIIRFLHVAMELRTIRGTEETELDRFTEDIPPSTVLKLEKRLSEDTSGDKRGSEDSEDLKITCPAHEESADPVIIE
eukprot:s166_g20.t1